MKKMLLIMMALVGGMTAGAQEVGEISDSVKAGIHSDNIKDAVNTVKGAFETKVVLADDELEKVLRAYVEKANVTPENTSITFRKNGTFSRSTAGRKQQGVWMVNGDRLMLAIDNVQIAELTTHLETDTMKMVVDVARVMGLLQKAGALSDSKTHNALIKISKRVKGVGGGFLMARKKSTAASKSSSRK